MNTNVRSGFLLLAALFALGGPGAASARNGYAADLPSAGADLLHPPSGAPPGEVATIATPVDTRFEQGHSLSVVTLTPNDPGNASLQLKLEGVIKPQVTAQPVDIDFGSVHHGPVAVRDVVVSDMMGGKGFALKSVKNES